MTVKINGKSQLIPIIGDPIIYAKSPEWLSDAFGARGMNHICVPMQVSPAELSIVFQGLAAVANIAGLLVTMPHKQAVFPLCTTVSERSQMLKTVSTMRRNADGGWHGDVLDGKSFVQAQINRGARPKGGSALLLGAGGAGSAIGVALLEAGIKQLVIHDVSEARAGQLEQTLTGLNLGQVRVGPPDPTGFDMVCNATPLGMSEGDPLPLDVSLLSPANFVGDVIAGHGETALLRAARLAGCKTANGDDMVRAVLEMTVDFFET